MKLRPTMVDRCQVEIEAAKARIASGQATPHLLRNYTDR